MDRIFDQEMKFSIKPNENHKQFFMQNDESIKNKIIKLLKDEFKDDIEISSQMKFGIEYFTEKFINNKNFTFVKYGDGELLCMLGAKGENCDFHPYTPKLGELLKESFGKLLAFEDVYLADWKDNLIDVRDMFIKSNKLNPKFADYDCFLTVHENIKSSKLINFYKLLKNSKRKKIFIGPKHLFQVEEMLNINKLVEVPSADAFSEYERIAQELKNDVENNNIYIFCCSMMSCVLCHDLKLINQNITLLDIGSGFDPIFSNKSRPKQPSRENCHHYYRCILPQNVIRKKNEIAQGILSKNSGLI